MSNVTRRTALKTMAAGLAVSTAPATVSATPRGRGSEPAPCSPSHPLHGAAIVALDGLMPALERLEDSRDEWDDTAVDAHSLRGLGAMTHSCLDCQLVGDVEPARQEARKRYQSLDPLIGAILAMHDAIDALGDLVAGHDCPDPWECIVCYHADIFLRPLTVVCSLASNERARNGHCAFSHPLVARREHETAKRRVARLRRAQASGRELLPAADYEHIGAEESLTLAKRWVQ